jgi:hypothetical protein
MVGYIARIRDKIMLFSCEVVDIVSTLPSVHTFTKFCNPTKNLLFHIPAVHSFFFTSIKLKSDRTYVVGFKKIGESYQVHFF